MKKIFMLLLSLTMVFGAATFATACDDGSESCTQHVDENSDGVCDNCDEAFTPEVKEVNVTFTVKDLEENTLSGVTVIFQSGNETPVTAVSGTDGTLSVTLKTGSYDVSYDYDVATVNGVGGYYLSNTTSITVKESTTAMNLYLENTTPNGTENRPFALSVAEQTITLPANTSYYYVVYRAVNLYAEIEGENVKVTYGSNVYTPDAEGKISIQFLGSSTNSTEKLLFENTSATEQTYTVNITSAPGTQSNPYELVLDEDITTKALANRESVYYTYTATASGKLTITVKSENSYISMTNTSNSLNATTEEGTTIELELNEGDVVSIDCSVSVLGSGTASVIFNATFTANE